MIFSRGIKQTMVQIKVHFINATFYLTWAGGQFHFEIKFIGYISLQLSSYWNRKGPVGFLRDKTGILKLLFRYFRMIIQVFL